MPMPYRNGLPPPLALALLAATAFGIPLIAL
jgi:hypothetical protein